MIIYKITNRLNGKSYIGQTSESLETRVKRHFGYQSRENDTKFYRAIRKYGKENFDYKIIDYSESQDELDEKEIFWINFFDTADNGYNTKKTKGKCGGNTFKDNPNMEIIRKHISDAVKGDNNSNASKIKVINLLTKEEKIFTSMKECQEEMNIPRHDIISKRCKKIIAKPYLGIYNFEYNNT